MEYNELVERFEMGEEFQFYYKNDSYWISQNEEEYFLTRERDSFSQSFESARELFANGKIADKTILELWDNIVI
ncbi:hypothetical protein E4V51_11435 [Paenibacillus sp. 28ISP30-2]|uniref:Uncharacterized protein n=1 Tax=Paenibacillus terrae TaxID=159743 RepID=A0A0D7WUX7_9BACL|nr:MULTISPECIES: hypothetical protein [Paenibacillus]ALP37940.1 hypothetical protein ASL14_18890 [Paenibacillus sp. IHB B 3084]KJD42975.1 hypothetical protein QD47_25265 [Paenibacillus terrae]MBE0337640.1 hypothetical protein [Paenibacillus sp. 23TSA30-6]MBE0341700.1 hypothetical protein [Paenibacillus sp. 28ISP30-2]